MSHSPLRKCEQINAFYLEKEAELKLRLETLLSKRRAAAMRIMPDSLDSDATKNHVEWSAVEEGFRLLERDIGKLQVDDRACVSPSSSYTPPAPTAIRGDQRHGLQEDSQEVGQAFSLDHKGAVSRPSGRGSTRLQPAGTSCQAA